MKPLSILLLALACSTEQDPAGASIDSEEEDSSTPTDGVTETETETTSSPSEIAVRVSEDIVTVAEVTWVTELATQGYIEFGETSEYGHQTPLSQRLAPPTPDSFSACLQARTPTFAWSP
jgi:hypothetical protein